MNIAVAITTFDKGDGQRTSVALRAIESLYTYLRYPKLIWYINDDSIVDEHSRILQERFDFKLLRSRGKGVGYGKNTMLREIFEITPLVLLLEDDWMLTEPFELTPHAVVLNESPSIGIVRLGYLGGNINATYESYNFYNYWRLHRGSGVYVYSGQVSLRHKRFYDSVGYHDEGIDPGNEELEMCKRFNGTDNAPDNIWPGRYGTGLNEGPFKNIGFETSTNGVQPV